MIEALPVAAPIALPLPGFVPPLMTLAGGGVPSTPAPITPGRAGSSPGRRQSETLELFDLDGTLTTPSFDSEEGRVYLDAAVHFVAERIPALAGQEETMRRGLLETIERSVYPCRHLPQFWAEFPTVQGRMVGVCPAVDHYLLAQLGVRLYLMGAISAEGPDSTLRQQVTTFLGTTTWANTLYATAASASAPYARMDDAAHAALESRLAKDALVAIFTNSSAAKAREVAKRAGFERYLIDDRLERGKLALIGSGKKGVIDEAWSAVGEQPGNTLWGDSVDVSRFFGGEGVTTVDLRRHAYHDRIADLVTQSGARRVWMVGDMVALELLPVANWRVFSPTVVMRQTPMSAPEEIAVARSLMGARVVLSLTDAISDLE